MKITFCFASRLSCSCLPFIKCCQRRKSDEKSIFAFLWVKKKAVPVSQIIAEKPAICCITSHPNPSKFPVNVPVNRLRVIKVENNRVKRWKKDEVKMAFVRFIGKLGSHPAIRISFANQNVHQIASSRVFSSSPMLAAAIQKPSFATAKGPPPAKPGKKDPLDTSFNDPIAAFKSKTTFELMRGYLVYLICSSETLVENNMKVSLIGIWVARLHRVW